MALRADSLSALERAAREEAEAAQRLAEAVREAGGAMAALDPAGLDEALARSRACADALSRAGNARAAHGRLAARALGLAEEATLAEILLRLEAGGLGATAAGLSRRLEEAAAEVAAQSLAARYGAGLWSHLLGFSGTGAGGAGYGPAGRMRQPAATMGRQA